LEVFTILIQKKQKMFVKNLTELVSYVKLEFQKVMMDNGGTASLDIIYENIEKYYPTAKLSNEWEAGIRGVLYREIQNNKRFKKIGFSIYALENYVEEQKPNKSE